MKKALFTLFLASFSALSLNAALICYAPMSSETDFITGGILTTAGGSSYKDGGLFGSGANQAGVGQWKLTLNTPVQLSKDWSFSFNSFVGVGEDSNQWGTALIGTNDDAYAPSFDDGFQLYLKGDGNLIGKVNSGNETNISGYTAGSWQHIGISYSNGALSVYINGNLAETIATTYSSSDTLRNLLNNNGSVGATANMGVKDIAVWDNALTAEEMKLLSSGTKPTDIVPEPSTSALGLVGIGLLLFKRKRN